uniref:Uncharacterized protein n=1 Tax=Rhizophagus irregularis (strain DAOM 181602 / DAOM 197198 / MUCL 43194) TaxID=747089 RepID=U9T618_RHIID
MWSVGISMETLFHFVYVLPNLLLNYSTLYKKLLSNIQSIDSLRELNSKLLAEIAELRKENAEIPELREKLLKFAEVEAENAKLKQIIKENARRDSENAELKSRVGELEARLALLEQGSAVDGMALSFQNGEEAMPVVTVPTVDVPDSVIDKLNNEVGRAPSDLDGNDEEMVDFLDDVYKKSISNKIRERRREKKQRDQEALVISQARPPFFIRNLFIGNIDFINSLLILANNFKSQSSFLFYTDGSFSRKTSPETNTHIGFAWAETLSTKSPTNLSLLEEFSKSAII